MLRVGNPPQQELLAQRRFKIRDVRRGNNWQMPRNA